MENSNGLILSLQSTLRSTISHLTSFRQVNRTIRQRINLGLCRILLIFLCMFSRVNDNVTSNGTIQIISVQRRRRLRIRLLLRRRINASRHHVRAHDVTIMRRCSITNRSIRRSSLVSTRHHAQINRRIFSTTLIRKSCVHVSLRRVRTIFLNSNLLYLVRTMRFPLLIMSSAIKQIRMFLTRALNANVRRASTRDRRLSTRARPQRSNTPQRSVRVLILSTLITHFLLIRLRTRANVRRMFQLVSFLRHLIRRHHTLIRNRSRLRFPSSIISRSSTSRVLRTSNSAVRVVLRSILRMFHHPFVRGRRQFTFIFTLLLLINRLTFLGLSVMFIDRPSRYLEVNRLLRLRRRISNISALSTNGTITSTAHEESKRK